MKNLQLCLSSFVLSVAFTFTFTQTTAFAFPFVVPTSSRSRTPTPTRTGTGIAFQASSPKQVPPSSLSSSPLHVPRSFATVPLYAAQAPLPPEPIDTNNNNNNNKPQRMRMQEDVYNFNKFLIDTVYNVICFIYPVTGTSRDYARFYVLETVARVPYFAYLSVMHLRETFGERNLGDKMRTHYAEADNELHHLLIMESLGGNEHVFDRMLAQTMSFFYYWYVVFVYILSPCTAYHLSELIEDHAFDTYSQYILDHGEMLKAQPVPAIAMKYYVDDDPYLFDLISTGTTVNQHEHTHTHPQQQSQQQSHPRRPKLETLYDVFINVRDDEKEHWKTLCNLVQYGEMEGVTSVQAVSSSSSSWNMNGDGNGDGDEFVVKATEVEPKSMPKSIPMQMPTIKSIMDMLARNY